jgi:hypothetical protein
MRDKGSSSSSPRIDTGGVGPWSAVWIGNPATRIAVIPAQAGIQGAGLNSFEINQRYKLDSRLRGNDDVETGPQSIPSLRLALKSSQGNGLDIGLRRCGGVLGGQMHAAGMRGDVRISVT